VLSCDLSLITIHISDCCQFSDVHISQDSVATYLRNGGIFKCRFVANLPMSQSVKEFWKSVNIRGSYGQEFSVVLLSLTHGVVKEYWRQSIHPVPFSFVPYRLVDYRRPSRGRGTWFESETVQPTAEAEPIQAKKMPRGKAAASTTTSLTIAKRARRTDGDAVVWAQRTICHR